MGRDKLNNPLPGQTRLTAEDKEKLIPGHLRFRSELNEWEQANINRAAKKYLLGRRIIDLFDIEVLKKIHRDMFNDTWQWAGQYRRNNTNLGKDWHQIPEEMKKVCDDLKYWDEHQTYPRVESAVRLHHRLVVIHPFPNGNGRHARMVADLFLHQHKFTTLPWGSGRLQTTSQLRSRYIHALQKADQGDFSELLNFAKS